MGWIRAGFSIGLLIALSVGLTGVARASGPLLMSGIFRGNVPGVKTQTALWVKDTEFFAPNTGTIAAMGKQGYTLTDLDINTLTGQRFYSAIFKSGVPSTTYRELAPAAFADEVVALAQQNFYLISLHTYVLPKNGKHVSPDDGQLFYSGIFQTGVGAQKFSGNGIDYKSFKLLVDANAKNGLFLTSMTSYLQGGQDLYVGVFRSLKQSPTAYNFIQGDWNSIGNQILASAAEGQRLVALSDDGQRNYSGTWIAGTDPYEVVAATDMNVFKRKVAEMGKVGLSLVRINIENTYEPPIGLARAFHNFVDGTPTGGYSYSISEKGVLTAAGGVGFARAPWDAAPPDFKLTPMWDNTRLNIGSVTKWITAAAVYKAIEDSNGAVTPETRIIDILGNGVISESEAGKFVDRITIRNLLDMNAGIHEGDCGQEDYYDADAYTRCVLRNCTQPDLGGDCTPPPPMNWAPPQPPAKPQYLVSNYSDPDFGILKVVIEHLQKTTFEEYVNRVLFVPLGVNNPAYLPTDIRNANCHIDQETPRRPLYYAASQDNGPGVEDQGYRDGLQQTSAQSLQRNIAVCGTGGMEMTAVQAAAFWSGMMNGKLFRDPKNLGMLLNNYVIKNFSTWSGQMGYWKNGGYPIYHNRQNQDQGATANVVATRDTDVQVSVFKNTWGALPSWPNAQSDPGGAQDPGSAIVDGLNWMTFHPADTISIATRSPGGSTSMCLNVKGGGTAPNTPIIQWPCGPHPLPANELFARVNSVADPSVFMLQVRQTLFSPVPMCVTSEYNNTDSGDQMILYACNGLENQQFKLGQPTSEGFTTIVDQVSQKCLTLDTSSLPGFTTVSQQYCSENEDPSQQFLLLSATSQ